MELIASGDVRIALSEEEVQALSRKSPVVSKALEEDSGFAVRASS